VEAMPWFDETLPGKRRENKGRSSDLRGVYLPTLTRAYRHALARPPGKEVIWNEGIREDTTVSTAIFYPSPHTN